MLSKDCEEGAHYLKNSAVLEQRPGMANSCCQRAMPKMHFINSRRKAAKVSWVQHGLQDAEQWEQLRFCTVILGWLAMLWGLRWHFSVAAVVLGLK